MQSRPLRPLDRRMSNSASLRAKEGYGQNAGSSATRQFSAVADPPHHHRTSIPHAHQCPHTRGCGAPRAASRSPCGGFRRGGGGGSANTPPPPPEMVFCVSCGMRWSQWRATHTPQPKPRVLPFGPCSWKHIKAKTTGNDQRPRCFSTGMQGSTWES